MDINDGSTDLTTVLFIWTHNSSGSQKAYTIVNYFTPQGMRTISAEANLLQTSHTLLT
jgi:hypothetical protein